MHTAGRLEDAARAYKRSGRMALHADAGVLPHMVSLILCALQPVSTRHPSRRHMGYAEIENKLTCVLIAYAYRALCSLRSRIQTWPKYWGHKRESRQAYLPAAPQYSLLAQVLLEALKVKPDHGEAYCALGSPACPV